MKTYHAGGTIGDAYVILCKLYSIAKKEKIIIKHYVAYKKLEKVIKEIYSLLPNINVEFMESERSGIQICGGFRFSNWEAEQAEYGFETEYYPKFELRDLGHFNLPKFYVTLQIKAGTHGKDRNLCMETVEEILNDLKLPVVLIGEKSTNLPIKSFNAINLQEKTSIKEVVNIIKNSNHFYGCQGFLSFVAVSQKVFSTVFLKFQSDVLAIQIRTKAIEEWNKYLVRKNKLRKDLI